MATQTPVEVENGLKAYVFVMRYFDKAAMVGCIASSRTEAEADVQARHNHPRQDEVSFSSCAFAVMQPAMITRWEKKTQWGLQERIEEKGCYAFLEGMFFGAYGDKRFVAQCAKRKTRDGWEAIIYHGDHRVKPL